MQTDCKQASNRAAVETERENAPRGRCDSPLSWEMNHEKLAEMTNSFHSSWWLVTIGQRVVHAESPSRLNFEGLFRSDVELKQFSLIDSDAEMPTRRKQIELIGHRERLSERTSHVDDAIVWSASNRKMQKSAEMTDSFRNGGRVTNRSGLLENRRTANSTSSFCAALQSAVVTLTIARSRALLGFSHIYWSFSQFRAIMLALCVSVENANRDSHLLTAAVPSVPRNAEIHGGRVTNTVMTWRNENHGCRRPASTAKRFLFVRRTRSSSASFVLASVNRRPTGRVTIPRIAPCLSQELRKERNLGGSQSRKRTLRLTPGFDLWSTSSENMESRVSSTIKWSTTAWGTVNVAVV